MGSNRHAGFRSRVSVGIALVCCLIALSAFADVSITALVDTPVVRLGESFRYSVTVSGMLNPPAIDPPDMPQTFSVYGPSTSTRIEMGTGRGMVSTVEYTYTLVPNKVGKFTIGAAALTVKGRQYLTETIEIEVVSGGVADDDQSATEDVFVQMQVDRQDVYLNQPIIATFSLYRGQNVEIHRNLSYTPPDTDGFFEQKLPDSPASQQRIGPKQYTVQRVRSIYIPLRSGDLVIGPARIDGTRIVRSRRRSTRRDFFDSFFDNRMFGESIPFSLQTDPIHINVRPLPEQGRPASFTGGVGTYDFEVLTPPREAAVGDSVTLTVRVAGRGYIQGVGPPSLSEVADCRVYEPESTLSVDTTRGIGGEKTFTYVLVPQREGLMTVPELALSYFDPEREQYVTERRGPFTLQVEAAPQAHPVTVVDLGENGKREIRVLGEDIFSIAPHVDRFVQSRPPSPAAAGVVLGLPPAVYAGLMLVLRRRERLRTDRQYTRRRAALRNARRRLIAANHAVRKGENGEFYQAIHRAVTDYLADKLDRPAAGLTVDDAGSILAGLGLDEQLIARVTDLLSVCDYGRFGSTGHDRHEQQELLKAAVALLRDLDRALRGSRLTVGNES